MVSYNEFGKFLRKQRVLKQIAIKTIAESLGCTSAYVSEVELGDIHPPIREDELTQWAEILGIDAEYLRHLADREKKIARCR